MKADIIAAATGKFTEPKHVGLLHTKMDLIRALNHYNVFATPDNLKAWSITYLHKNHAELVEHISKAPVVVFGTHGALCRLSERGFNFDADEKKRIHRYFLDVQQLVIKAKNEPKVEVVKPVSTKIKYTRSREAFEMAIDETLYTGKLVMPSLIMTENHKDIAEICQQYLKDIEGGPEYFDGSITLQKKFFKTVLEKVEKVKDVKKASGTSIIKNPAKQVAAVKYLHSIKMKTKLGEFRVPSVDPIDTIERKKMYVYDAKYRRLIVFMAMTAAGFQWSGTTLKNVDLKKSYSKTIRKPEEFFPGTTISIAALNKAFDEIKAKPTPMVASRFNADWLILRATEKGA